MEHREIDEADRMRQSRAAQRSAWATDADSDDDGQSSGDDILASLASLPCSALCLPQSVSAASCRAPAVPSHSCGTGARRSPGCSAQHRRRPAREPSKRQRKTTCSDCRQSLQQTRRAWLPSRPLPCGQRHHPVCLTGRSGQASVAHSSSADRPSLVPPSQPFSKWL